LSARLGRYGHKEPNLLAIAAQTAAYQYCSGWVDELTAVLRGNMQILLSYIGQTPIRSYMPDSTYLLWLDCRDMGMNDGRLMNFFINRCGVYPNSGEPFGAEGFARINAAAPEAVIQRIGSNIQKAF